MGIESKIKAIAKPSSYTRGFNYIKNNGLFAASKKLCSKFYPEEAKYNRWWNNHKPTKEQLAKQMNHQFAFSPKISIVIPLYKTPEKFLNKLVFSIKNQSYGNWELVLSDGSGPGSPLNDILAKLQSEDRRIKVVKSDKPLQISENTNLALDSVSGDYIAFGDHDDEYALNALYECVKVINKHPDVEFIYTDEDKIDTKGFHFGPHFKSDFNYDLLTCNNYICHLVVVKTSLQKKVGGLRSEFDGAQDFDFVLRCVENTNNIVHIPKILYHWRAHRFSTAGNPESKDYAWEAGRRAVQAHYDRINVPANVQMTQFLGNYRTYYVLSGNPLVSIVIPNKDHIDDLKRCLRSIWFCNTYRNFEIIIVENNSVEDATFDYYKELEQEHNIKVVKWIEKGFNFSKIINFGVSKCSGDYVLLLNNDTEIIEPDSIRQMLCYCQRDDVGVVGAKLYFGDTTIQHAGVTIGMYGNAGHNFCTQNFFDAGYYNRTYVPQDLSAVTGACLLTKTELFKQVKGFEEDLAVAYNDIDYCLKIRDIEKLVVFNPYAQLWHYESVSRGSDKNAENIKRFNLESDYFKNKWKNILSKGDPYYNPNLTLRNTDFSIDYDK